MDTINSKVERIKVRRDSYKDLKAWQIANQMHTNRAAMIDYKTDKAAEQRAKRAEYKTQRKLRKFR
jgi:hypothetical protein